MTARDQIVVVLWETQNYVNIAGAIRAMKNFGLGRLRLVNPTGWDPWRIEGIAHDTRDLVEATEIFDTLSGALADCTWIVGLTARERRAKRAVARPRDIAPEILERAATGGPVALMFGREDNGLSNEALDMCHRTVTIPTNPEHSSLNLAQAVLLIAYELWMVDMGAGQPFKEPRRSASPVNSEQLEALFADVEQALWAVDFFKSRRTEATLRTVRELVHRADLDAREASFLRAIAIEVRKFVARQS